MRVSVERREVIRIVRSGTGLQAQGSKTILEPCPTIMAGGLGGGIVPNIGLKMME